MQIPSIQELALYCCVLPAIVLLIAAFIVFRNFARFLRSMAPDTAELHRRYAALRAAHPKDSQQQLVRRIVDQYAFGQGIVGAITSFGGIITVPLGLTIDLFHAGRSNTALSYFIAQIYGVIDSEALDLGQLLALGEQNVPPKRLAVWQGRLSRLAQQQLLKMVLKKSFAKLIPGIGAIVGFIVNYSTAQAFGRAAERYYSNDRASL